MAGYQGRRKAKKAHRCWKRRALTAERRVKRLESRFDAFVADVAKVIGVPPRSEATTSRAVVGGEGHTDGLSGSGWGTS